MKGRRTRSRAWSRRSKKGGGASLFGEEAVSSPATWIKTGRNKPSSLHENSIVTEVSFLPGKAAMVAVFLPDGTIIRMPDEVAAAAGIGTGTRWTSELRHRVAHLTAVWKAKREAVKFLSTRLRSEAEVRQRLSSKGFHDAAVDTAVNQLVSAGMIDDARLVRDIAFTELVNNRTARHALKERLLKRGFREDDAERAIREGSDVSEMDRARELIRDSRRKMPRGLERQTVWRRLMSRLAAAGFDEELAGDAVDEAIGGPGE